MSIPTLSPAIGLYLDLLKKSLTQTHFAKKPDADETNQNRFVGEFIQHYMQGNCVTMLPLARLDNLQ